MSSLLLDSDPLEDFRQRLLALMGDLPLNVDITAKFVAEDEYEDFFIEHLVLNLNNGEDVPAYFTKPKNAQAPYPTVLFSHSHGGFYNMGKKELLEPAPYMYQRPYAADLAKMGIASLAIDHYCFGERSGRSESATFKSMLWDGKVMWGMMVFDSLQAVNYLHTRADVDTSRIGALGMSMGSTMSIWTTALDPRIKICADICCLTDFTEIEKQNGLDAHGIYYYVPKLRAHFTMGNLVRMIAPRPHLSTVGYYDALTPPGGIQRIEDEKQYFDHNHQINTYPVAHQETREMREDVLAFIRRNL